MPARDVSLHALDARQIPVDWNPRAGEDSLEFAALMDPRDRRRRAAFRHAARRILASLAPAGSENVQWTKNAFGKPSLPGGPFFNLSHAGDTALLAICPDAEVGVDLEPRARGSEILDCLPTIAHPVELVWLNRLPAAHLPHALIRLWVAKEAALKALGTGLSIEPSSFSIRWSDALHATVDGLSADHQPGAVIHITRVEIRQLPDFEVAVALLGAHPRALFHEPLREAAFPA